MSVSSEWTSLRATWGILLLALAARIFLSGQFLLTPDEALYWQAGHFVSPTVPETSPVLSWLIGISTALIGNSEIAVRMPSIISIMVASFYIALIAAAMFSWHTALHVTILSQALLQFNLAALIISPYSLILACWSAVCYHSSQAMHSNRTGEWLLAGFWLGVGLACKFSMILILPFIMVCFIFIKSFRTCLLYSGPWLGFLLSAFIFAGYRFWTGNTDLVAFITSLDIKEVTRHITPDLSYSLQFLLDQTILLTPVVFLLILGAWLTGPNRRHIVQADAQFLYLNSFPLFLLFLLLPVFADDMTAWSAPFSVTALVLIAGLHSSTRSNFKGSPKIRWVVGCATAYLATVFLLLHIAYPARVPLPVNLSQVQFLHYGWNLLGKEIGRSLQQMPEQEKTFVFCLEPKITGELAFYIPGHPQSVALDRTSRTLYKETLENQLQLPGKDGIGLVSTRDALDKVKLLFERIELERELRLQSPGARDSEETRTYYIVRGFHFKSNKS